LGNINTIATIRLSSRLMACRWRSKSSTSRWRDTKPSEGSKETGRGSDCRAVLEWHVDR